ncbi:MAG: hypothetical protein KC668_18115, partial [Myxococcales bacterium]|nr:hypothetical protein [Myxococcales bacterium]
MVGAQGPQRADGPRDGRLDRRTQWRPVWNRRPPQTPQVRKPMDKALLIVESPAKAKTIKKYVGNRYDVLASKGHIKDLPKKGGVDMEHGFEESYELLEEKGKAEIIKAIRTSAKKVGKVLLATDPDREG